MNNYEVVDEMTINKSQEDLYTAIFTIDICN